MNLQRPIEYLLPELLGDRTLALAESCTGGALAARIVSVPGSSSHFLGGLVAYSNDIKVRLLGVPAPVLIEHGAVSEECALEMARGARRVFGADLAVSTTGIAGPEGGSEGKPVGLVYIALVTPDEEVCTCNVWTGDREQNIRLSVDEGLRLIYRYLCQT